MAGNDLGSVTDAWKYSQDLTWLQIFSLRGSFSQPVNYFTKFWHFFIIEFSTVCKLTWLTNAPIEIKVSMPNLILHSQNSAVCVNDLNVSCVSSWDWFEPVHCVCFKIRSCWVECKNLWDQNFPASQFFYRASNFPDCLSAVLKIRKSKIARENK